MKKLIVFIFISFLAFACSEDKTPLTLEQAEVVMEHYYQNQDAKKLIRALYIVDDNPSFSRKEVAPLQGYLVGLALSQEELYRAITEQIEWRGAVKFVLQDIPYLISTSQANLNSDSYEAKSVAELEFDWSAFTASGDERFITIVVRTANSSTAAPSTRDAAKWLLSEQRKEHPKVEALLISNRILN